MCQCSLDVSFLEVVLPSFLVLAMKACHHYPLLMREGEHVVLASVENDTTKGFKLFKAIVVDDLAADLGDDSDISRIHEQDVEHGDGEARWDLVLAGL